VCCCEDDNKDGRSVCTSLSVLSLRCLPPCPSSLPCLSLSLTSFYAPPPLPLAPLIQAVMEQREARKAAAAEGADTRTVSGQGLMYAWGCPAGLHMLASTGLMCWCIDVLVH
jgi:hypothetical protein